MPGIMPRLKGFFTSGFEYIAFLMAQIYAMVRLLPDNHPYLNPQNIGKFSIRNVIAQAANNLILKKENADQIIIFGAILIALVLLIIQFAMIIIALVFEPAMAAFPAGPYPTGMSAFGSMFRTADPTFDIAFMLLDQVFGVPGLFGSCIDLNVACGGTVDATPAGGLPWPFHIALHQLFNFYNSGILVVGALIFLYFIVIVVGETAVTGTPFGQRFQNIWVPIRLVVAIGLLIPLPMAYAGNPAGFNTGQYITLAAAKFGSSMATNGWVVYNNTIRTGGVFPGGDGANPLGERESLIGNPNVPDVTHMLEAMSLVHVCAWGEWYAAVDKTVIPPTPDTRVVQAYFFKSAPSWMPDTRTVLPLAAGTAYTDALTFFNNGDITIQFGYLTEETAASGSTPATYLPRDKEPACGEMTISIHQVGGAAGIVGPEAVQENYYDLIRDMWFTPDTYELDAFGYRYAAIKMQTGTGPDQHHSCRSPTGGPPVVLPAAPIPRLVGAAHTGGPVDDNCNKPPLKGWRTHNLGQLEVNVTASLTTIYNNYVDASALYEMNDDILRRGWAGAGIWYNTISRVNGNYTSSVREIPRLSKYPSVMPEISKAQNRENEEITSVHKFCPNESEINATINREKIGLALCETYRYWNENSRNTTQDTIVTGSAFEDAMNLIFGAQQLNAMTDSNINTHPLAQLALLGKGLVDASIRNIATATTISAVGGLGAIFDKIIPGLVTPSADFILSTAFVGLTAGLVLYYIVPFLPFIYFFFAVSSWVKTIFEAMVGVPLWALAHLRIDGEGLPGNSAANGYFLILEIFLRPILTVFGLIAATLIFTAQVRVLHFLWQLVTENLTGFDSDPTIAVGGVQRFAFKRSIIDQFFFNVIYAIIVYMMAIAAFKLIDKIPDNLLRWMGNSVSSFGDINQDNVDGLTRYAALGGATAGRELASGVQQLGSGIGQTAGGTLSRLSGGP